MIKSPKNSDVGLHEYSNVLVDSAREKWDASVMKIEWIKPDDFFVKKKLGRGKYSEVFQSVNKKTGEDVCIKILRPVKMSTFKNEVFILQRLRRGPNIVRLHDCFKDPISRVSGIITELVFNVPFPELYPTFTQNEVQYYMFKVLLALDYCHSKGIMHRDLKPHNIMIDRASQELRIIDWGLACFYFPNQSYSTHVATRFYKAPELLVGFGEYDYRVDIWSFGCTLAGIIFIRHPFFNGLDLLDQLVKIAAVLGTDKLYEFLDKYGISLDPAFSTILSPSDPVRLETFITSKNRHFGFSNVIDLLKNIFKYDFRERLTAKECLDHSFFDEVRDELTPRRASFLVQATV